MPSQVHLVPRQVRPLCLHAAGSAGVTRLTLLVPPAGCSNRLACARKSSCWWPAFALSCPRRESNRARARPANFVCQPPVWLARCVARSRGIGKRLASPPSFAVITLIHHTKAHITRRVRNTQELRQRFSAQLLAWKSVPLGNRESAGQGDIQRRAWCVIPPDSGHG